MRVVALTHVFPRAADDANAPFLLTWARALRAAGVEVSVVAPHDAGLPRVHEVDGVPVRLARYAPDARERMAYRGEMHQLVRSPSGPPLVASLTGSLALAVRAAARDADLLHVHWWVPGAIAARLARPRVPVVVTLHGTDVALVEGRPRLAAVARWALTVADRVEVVSSDLADRLERTTGVVADAVNPMPLEASWFEGPVAGGARSDSGPPRVLAVGRMVPEKGFTDLVQAVALLERPVALELVGDGPELPRLLAEAERLGVTLETPGRLPPGELRAAYARADVLAMPSHREGLGLVAAEAVLSGLPVVAADSGGVRDLLPVDSLVRPGDVEGLAAGLRRVLADPVAARAGLAPIAERLRERLAPDVAAARTLTAYRALLPRSVSGCRTIDPST